MSLWLNITLKYFTLKIKYQDYLNNKSLKYKAIEKDFQNNNLHVKNKNNNNYFKDHFIRVNIKN